MKLPITLTTEEWRSVEQALLDFLIYGPGDLNSEYIPDNHLLKARAAIIKQIGETK